MRGAAKGEDGGAGGGVVERVLVSGEEGVGPCQGHQVYGLPLPFVTSPEGIESQSSVGMRTFRSEQATAARAQFGEKVVLIKAISLEGWMTPNLKPHIRDCQAQGVTPERRRGLCRSPDLAHGLTPKQGGPVAGTR